MLWLDCGFSGHELNPIESLKSVRVPIYFCHGVADKVTPFEEGEAVYKAYNGPKWCYWVDDATHLSLSDQAQQEYFLRMRAFIKEHLPPR